MNSMCEICKIKRKALYFHCDDCGVCIEEIDHHCVFYGKCISERNKNHFNCVLCIFLISGMYLMVLTIYNNA